MMDKEYIESIVYKKVNDYLSKGNLEDEKCGKPSYITGLPGDLRSTDPNVLKERLDAIDTRLKEIEDEVDDNLKQQKGYEHYFKELEDENNQLQKNIDDYNKLWDNVYDEETKIQNNALDESTDIRHSWNDIKDTANTGDGEGIVVTDMPKVKGTFNLDTLMNMFGVDEFEYKGLLYSEDVDFIKSIADSVEEYGLMGSDGTTISDWTEYTVGLADEIREFADKYDINNKEYNSLTKDLGKVVKNKDSVDEWGFKISQNNEELELARGEYDDLVKERISLLKEQTDLKEERKLTSAKYIKVKD